MTPSHRWTWRINSVLIVIVFLVSMYAKIKIDYMAARAVEAERLSSLTLMSAPIPLVSCDETGKVLSFNHAAENLTGWEANVLIGRSVDSLLPEPFRAHHHKVLASAAARLRDSSSEWSECASRIGYVLCANGDTLRVIVFARLIRVGDSVVFVSAFKLAPPSSKYETLETWLEGYSEEFSDGQHPASVVEGDSPG